MLDGVGLAALVCARVWQPELAGAPILPLALIFYGGTSFGALHEMTDYAFMSTVNSWNWDCPPGCGYPTVVGIAIAAGLCFWQAPRAFAAT